MGIHAVLHLKNGSKLYYVAESVDRYAILAQEFLRKTGFWLAVYQSFEDMVKGQNLNQFVMTMDLIEKIEYVGVRLSPNGDNELPTVTVI